MPSTYRGLYCALLFLLCVVLSEGCGKKSDANIRPRTSNHQTRSGSCAGRCDNPYDSNFDCQCNTACHSHNDCCNDYDAVCDASGGVSNANLAAISEAMLRSDPNNAGSRIEVNVGGHTSSCSTSDKAPNKLFTRVDPSVWTQRTFDLLIKLHDNYDRDTNNNEDHTSDERNEEQNFIEAVMDTNVMKMAYNFLTHKGVFTGSKADFQAKLDSLWFGPYSRKARGQNRNNNRRGGAPSSSGFEHVFLGEIKKNEVSGFHNWIRFEKLEKKGKLNYLGELVQSSFDEYGKGLSFVFKWDNYLKCFGSMLVGTSPEYDMAIYTICFLTRPSGKCKLKMNGKTVTVTTYPLTYGGNTYIGTAYPDF